MDLLGLIQEWTLYGNVFSFHVIMYISLCNVIKTANAQM